MMLKKFACLLVCGWMLTGILGLSTGGWKFTSRMKHRIEPTPQSAVGVTVFKRVSQAICLSECRADDQCNGFNYHTKSSTCEIFSVAMKMQFSADGAGWLLWLPEACPDLIQRPAFYSTDYAMFVGRVPVLSRSIFCHVNENGVILPYINLPTSGVGNYATNGSGLFDRFTKYGLDVVGVTICHSDLTFASTNNYWDVGHALNCDCKANLLNATLKLDLTGTQFKLSPNVQVVDDGNNIEYAELEVSEQSVNVSFNGCCSNIYLRNPYSVLKLVATSL